MQGHTSAVHGMRMDIGKSCGGSGIAYSTDSCSVPRGFQAMSGRDKRRQWKRFLWQGQAVVLLVGLKRWLHILDMLNIGCKPYQRRTVKLMH